MEKNYIMRSIIICVPNTAVIKSRRMHRAVHVTHVEDGTYVGVCYKTLRDEISNKQNLY
jgi:hypothetical protein